ncbi:integrin beta-PS isoform X2 [Folsomia candida]|nr:integrin beta-PS isoform X2 [Folsomia candida]
MEMSNLLMFISGFIVIGNFQEIPPPDLESLCESKTQSCAECLQTPECMWCKDPNVNIKKRCVPIKSESGSSCQEFENQTSVLEMNEDAQESAVRPFHVHVKLRPGSRHKINVTMAYTDEENRPLDLYILMDLSCTMSTHKDRVAKLAKNLAENLRLLTSGLRMGFGSFIDKPVLPYAQEKETKITCNGKEFPFKKPHLFKNELSLTSDIDTFTKSVNDSEILFNNDVPEGGLDALMQVLVCKDELGWRYENNTRRLIVLSTDGPFHIAGDGRLGGILLPNEGRCHLNAKGEYDKATVLDYPTVSQIRDKIHEHNIYVIFAVTNQHKRLYRRLAEKIGLDLSSVSVITEDDSSSLTKVIEEEYKKVARTVNFQPVIRNPFVDVTLYAKCPGSSEYRKGNGCNNLTPKARVEYRVELGLKRCPPDATLWRSEVAIRPSTFSSGNDNFLNVTIDMVCDCGCEKSTQTSLPPSIQRIPQCNNKGFQQCGICKCDEGVGGPFCNCTVSDAGVKSVDQEMCLYGGELCSNRGSCVCGKCDCKKGYVGTHCECLEKDCPAPAPDDKGHCNANAMQGSCECNPWRCKCNPGFTGERCQCPTSDEMCRYSSKVCSNFGHCKCGKCICNAGYHGNFCELKVDNNNAYSSECTLSLQRMVEPCIKCLAFDYASTFPVSTRLSSCKGQCGSESVGMIKPTLHEKID